MLEIMLVMVVREKLRKARGIGDDNMGTGFGELKQLGNNK